MLEDLSTLPITRCGLADAIDGYEDRIAALQNAKREEFNAYRAELLKAGYEQAAVRVEIEACKATIRTGAFMMTLGLWSLHGELARAVRDRG